MDRQWLIYGATGYTGRLVAAQARREGMEPILAGRDGAALAVLAGELSLPFRVAALDRPEALQAALEGVAVVAHCAGPFSATAGAMQAACLRAGAHYVDITGEIAAFEATHAQDAAARAAGVILCPGVGFDVIPTDCVAACLKAALPDATHLALGFETGSGMSRGTALTTVEGLGKGGAVRIDGAIRRVAVGSHRRRIDFGNGERHAVAIPWGDVATAWYSTAIPDIAVYVPVPRAAAMVLRPLDLLRPLLAARPVQAMLKAQVARRISGPDEAARRRSDTYVWGEVRNRAGERRTARLRTANVYDVTVHGVLAAVRHLLGHAGEGGYRTPSQLLGERCVERFPGSGPIVVER